MPTIAQRLRAAYKTFSQGDWISSDAPGNIYSSGRTGRAHWIPGTIVNWDRLTGELWMCPAVQACLNWIFRNFPQAPPIVQKKDAKGEWTAIPDHPLVTLLNRPNPQYDGSILFQGLILSLETNGNAYAIIERTRGGQVAELWWVPHNRITPYTAPGNDPRIIDYYDYWLGPTYHRVPPEDILHLKYGLDPNDPRLGLAPIASATRDVNALQQAGNYRPTVLRNFGNIGRTVSPDDPNVIIEPETVKAYIDANSLGDKAGSTLVFDFKAKIEHPGVSPESMALNTLEDRPEADICGLIGIPIQVAGLHGGREAKTYENMRQAREAAWEEKLIPLGSMLAGQIGHRFLEEFERETDPVKLQAIMSQMRMSFDYSDIRPLQPDLDALHARLLKDWLANLITLGQWYEMSKEPEPTDLPDWETTKLQRYKDLGGQPQQITERGASVSTDQAGVTAAEPKSLEWAERVIRDIELTHSPKAVAMNGNGTGH